MKRLLLLICMILVSGNLCAHNWGTLLGIPVFAGPAPSWVPVQISVWPIHLFPWTNVYGVVLSPGLLGGSHNVYGISCGVITFCHEQNGLAVNVYSIGQENNGLSIGVFNTWGSNHGVVVGLANFLMNSPGRNALQIGVFNQAKSGLQLGFLNYNPNAKISWMPFFNWSAE